MCPNLQRWSCGAGTFQHSDVHQCPGKDLQCQVAAVVPSPWMEAQKRAGKKSLSRPFLASGLYLASLCCEELLAGCRSVEGASRRRCFFFFYPPICSVAINQTLPKSLPLPLSVIPKDCLSLRLKIHQSSVVNLSNTGESEMA